jgi:hypothetical protein
MNGRAKVSPGIESPPEISADNQASSQWRQARPHCAEGRVCPLGEARLGGASKCDDATTTLVRSTQWHFAESGGRDVGLARGKIRRAAWPLNPEKGDASFMAAAPLALGQRLGVRG